MRKNDILLFIFRLLVVLVFAIGLPFIAMAQPVTDAKRNDGFATTLQGTNLGNMPISATDKGVTGAIEFGYGRTANPTPVALGTPGAAYFDKSIRQVVIPQQIREQVVSSGVITLSSTTAETTLMSAGAAGVFHDLTSIWCSNTSGTVTRIDVRDATGGTIRFPLEVPPTDMRGVVLQVPFPQTTAANNWTVQSSASIADVRCVGNFVKNF